MSVTKINGSQCEIGCENLIFSVLQMPMCVWTINDVPCSLWYAQAKAQNDWF